MEAGRLIVQRESILAEFAILVAAEVGSAVAGGTVAAPAVVGSVVAAVAAAIAVVTVSDHGLVKQSERRVLHGRQDHHAYSCRQGHPQVVEQRRTGFEGGHLEEFPVHLHSTRMVVFPLLFSWSVLLFAQTV